VIQLVVNTIQAAMASAETYHIHLFHLASVIAHLMTRSIRFTIAGPGHVGDWTWEVQYFGGSIERILAPNPYTRVSSRIWTPSDRQGETIELAVSFHDQESEAHSVLSPGVLRNLIEGTSSSRSCRNICLPMQGQEDWEINLPLWFPWSPLVRGRHRDQVRFVERPEDEEQYEMAYEFQSKLEYTHCFAEQKMSIV
jgi:hypothetical protein